MSAQHLATYKLAPDRYLLPHLVQEFDNLPRETANTLASEMQIPKIVEMRRQC